jgi:nucleobase:cation symporter-1, NCS1 family
MYMMGWVLTFVTASVVYFILITVFKPKIYPAGFESLPVKWEWLAVEGRDGFFDGEQQEIYAPPSPPMTDGGDVHLSDKEKSSV